MQDKRGIAAIWWIVTVVIAVVVLITLYVFYTGGLAKGFGVITGIQLRAGAEADVQTAQATCQDLCSRAKQIGNPNQWSGQAYCTTTFPLDINRDGTIGPDESNIKCWEAPISISCTATSRTTRASFSCDQSNCPGEAGGECLECTKGSQCSTSLCVEGECRGWRDATGCGKKCSIDKTPYTTSGRTTQANTDTSMTSAAVKCTSLIAENKGDCDCAANCEAGLICCTTISGASASCKWGCCMSSSDCSGGGGSES